METWDFRPFSKLVFIRLHDYQRLELIRDKNKTSLYFISCSLYGFDRALFSVLQKI
jgi:hypothetical protein